MTKGIDLMAQILKLRNVLSLSTKYAKCFCKSACYAVTNLLLTSSCILSLLILNSYASIAGTDAKQVKALQHISHQDYFLLKSCHQNWTTEKRVWRASNIRKCQSHRAERGISFKVFLFLFCIEGWPFHVTEFLQPVFQHSIGSTRHRFFYL